VKRARSHGGVRIAASVVLVGGALYHVAEALELRRRLGLIPTLPPVPETSDGDRPGDATLVAAEGVTVDAATLAVAVEDLASSNLDVVDLVPGDLAVEPALRFLRRVNPTKLREDRFATPGGAHEAVVLSPSVAALLGVPVDGSRDRGGMMRLTAQAQRYAAGSADIRLAPGLRAGPFTAADRWGELEALAAFADPYLHLAPVFVGADLVQLVGMAAGLAVAPVPAALALVAWSAKPAIVFGGRPPDRPGPAGVATASLLRLPRTLVAGEATVRAGWRATGAERRRLAEAGIVEQPPVEKLFDPVRATCPWCGDAELDGLVDVGDLFQCKPGEFHLDRCGSCGHVFQNPAVSNPGLDYYYDQFYDGPGESMTDVMFASLGRSDDRRVEAVARLTEPASWLDVGTGHGHFCARARLRWPDARIDGFDMSDSVEEAARRRWVDHAYRGAFVDFARDSGNRYDVVSMHHYLEHTRDPRREVEAALAMLNPGGHLMIEVPDPESPWARRLGRWWFPWSQPQHLHLLPCANLLALLGEQDAEVVSVERGPATLGGDLLGAVAFAIQSITKSPHLPWLPPATPAQRVARAAAVAAGLPLVVLAGIADQIKDARLGPDDIGNAYRVIARKAPVT
jgi:SAM-dependent methyltransferase